MPCVSWRFDGLTSGVEKTSLGTALFKGNSCATVTEWGWNILSRGRSVGSAGRLAAPRISDIVPHVPKAYSDAREQVPGDSARRPAFGHSADPSRAEFQYT